MAFNDLYSRQVELLVRVIPFVAAESCFALKGGTAINLFVRNLPRLSVDIDLAYLPVEPRAQSLVAIDAAMTRIAKRIVAAVPKVMITEAKSEGAVTKLFVRTDAVQVKIEVTPVLRGCVFEPELRAVSGAVEDKFGFAEIAVVSFADLYAGKIVAALDRQHPRDLFDVRDLIASEGVADALRQAFIIYLLSHSRPMYEVLAPRRKDITGEFQRGFTGMTDQTVSQIELEQAREALIAEVVGNMPAAHRRFLIGFERGEPDWSLIGLPDAARLPAFLWRQHNLDGLSAEQRDQLVARLVEVLGGEE